MLDLDKWEGVKIMKSIFFHLKNKLLKIKYKKGLKTDKIQDHFFLLDQNKVDKRQKSDFFLFVKWASRAKAWYKTTIFYKKW